MSEPNNPFSGLLSANEVKAAAGSTVNESAKTVSQSDINLPTEITAVTDANVYTINSLVESIFHITINPNARTNDSQDQLVFLEELGEAIKPNIYIDLESLEQALFERLLLPEPEASILPKGIKIYQDHVIEKKIFPYLFGAMQSLSVFESTNDEVVKHSVDKMKELIFRNSVTALKQPGLFEGQDLTEQLVEMLKHVDPLSQTFFTSIVTAFMSDDDPDSPTQLKEVMLPVLKKIHIDIYKSSLVSLPIYILPVVHMFASNQHLATILMESCEPKRKGNGRLYQECVLGGLLSLSVLPKNPTSPYEFFTDSLDQSGISMIENSIWNASAHISDNLHKIFLALLKGGPEMRTRILQWIGDCLKTNTARGKLWNMESGINASSITCVTDGFMLSLGMVLLRLCQPFCNTHDDPKSLKIDPTYGAVTPEESASKSVHLDCLHSETCLLPSRESEDGTTMKPRTAPSYSFVTECFFMAQKCIDLGVRVCAEKLHRVGQELGRAQRALQDLAESNAQHLVQPLRQNAQHLMTKYVSLRCALLEPQSLTMLYKLQAVTCTWLVQVALRPDPSDTQACYAPGEWCPVVLPATLPPPDTLRCIPEFMLENIIVLITMSRRTGGEESDSQAVMLMHPALTLVLAFMGDASRIYNPHLRARLAECLEALLPKHPDHDQPPLSTMGSFYREQLFKEHPHRLQLVPCLLDVFVGIEMTGQSVQFEQKFNYRRPMYLVMDFLWGIQEHKDAMTKLAREAEANMEAVHPPIFLRFVNLLINDAIFLLDEALSNMAQIKTLQASRESGAWANMPAQEREQNLANLSHIGMLARIDNILGRDTSRTLVRLTAHAPYVFCHPTLVDRVASMLNYFLLNLVGPNKKNLKVKDSKEFEFEPANTVLDICRMYVELGSNERFCEAVCSDGRSYSPQLFSLAEAVLVRIGGGSLIGSLQEVGLRVAEIAKRRALDEEALSNAPEEFLDPIMSTLMMDPVILPSSRTTVDRTTIARHLLSDQSDPFNRSPLSMDQVKSDTELKERIHTWIAMRRQKSNTNSQMEISED